MGTLDDIEAAIAGHRNQLEQAIDTIGGRFADRVDQVRSLLKGAIGGAGA